MKIISWLPWKKHRLLLFKSLANKNLYSSYWKVWNGSGLVCYFFSRNRVVIYHMENTTQDLFDLMLCSCCHYFTAWGRLTKFLISGTIFFCQFWQCLYLFAHSWQQMERVVGMVSLWSGLWGWKSTTHQDLQPSKCRWATFLAGFMLSQLAVIEHF